MLKEYTLRHEKIFAASFTSCKSILSSPADFAGFSLSISPIIESGVCFRNWNLGLSVDDIVLSKYFNELSDSSYLDVLSQFLAYGDRIVFKASAALFG